MGVQGVREQSVSGELGSAGGAQGERGQGAQGLPVVGRKLVEV